MSTFTFRLNYMDVDDCLQQILQLKRASSLPPPDQSSMIAAISYSKHSRLKFDPNWLDDLYETIELEVEASRVSPLVVNPGRVVLTSNKIYFQSFNNAEWFPVLKIALCHIAQVKLRRFVLRPVGLEIFCSESPVDHLYLSFKCEKDRNRLYDVLVKLADIKLSGSDHEIMTLKWQNYAISNFEYLQYINSVADRSVNDLTQYPVFPWVIADYSSPQIDLDNPQTYRDLTKPMGALNTERLARLKKRRYEMPPPGYLYGSHYSAPAFVLFYLVRKCPQLMLCLQNGRFDHPDRIFHSVADVWKNVMQNLSDFKELTPEFYDVSNGGDFLVNSLGLDLGTRQDGRSVHDVILPPWCDNAQHFVQKLRDALESSYVSQNLPAWIDLVFGCKQRGRAADDSDNVFHPLSYEGAVNLDSIDDMNERNMLEVQIMEFGQIPKQVFHVAHPPRMQLDPACCIAFQKSHVNEYDSCVIGSHRDAVTALAFRDDVAVSVSRDALLKEYRCSTKQMIRSVHIDTIGISAVVLLPGGEDVVLGTFDNRIMLYELECSKVNDEVRAHEDAVTVLCWSEAARLLVSGSWDGSLLVWPGAGSGPGGRFGRLKTTPTVRFDHDSKVTCACLDSEGRVAACGTHDGDIFVYQLSSKAVMFQENVGFPISDIIISKRGSRLVASNKQGCHIFDLMTGLLVHTAKHSTFVTSLCWLTEEYLLMGDSEGAMHCWDLGSVEPLHTFKSPAAAGGPVTALAVSSSTQFIICAQDSKVILFSY